MAFSKKTVILSDINSKEGTGIIRLTEDGDRTVAEVILHGAYKQNNTLLLKGPSGPFAFHVSEKCTLDLTDFDISSTIDCLLIDGDGKSLLYGSTGVDKYRCFNLATEYFREKEKKESTKKLPKKEEKIQEEKTVETSDKPDEKLPSDDEAEQEIPENKEGFSVSTAGLSFGDSAGYEGENFYLAVKPQLDEMFTCYPVDNELIGILPSSNWVRVDTGDDYYVVGIIYDLDEPKYICYGIHGEYAQKPPDEIKDVCDWLPLNLDNPEGAGYWMIYQDCVTGKTVKR